MFYTIYINTCFIASKINVTLKGVYLYNTISQICYCGQISLQSAVVNCRISVNATHLGVTLILLAMVRIEIFP